MSWKRLNIPVYKKEVILDAIKREGLVDEAWGYETEYCIWIYTAGMEKRNIWKEFPTPLHGYKCAAYYDSKQVDEVTYFILEDYPNLRNIDEVYYRIPLIEPIKDLWHSMWVWWYLKKTDRKLKKEESNNESTDREVPTNTTGV